MCFNDRSAADLSRQTEQIFKKVDLPKNFSFCFSKPISSKLFYFYRLVFECINWDQSIRLENGSSFFLFSIVSYLYLIILNGDLFDLFLRNNQNLKLLFFWIVNLCYVFHRVISENSKTSFKVQYKVLNKKWNRTELDSFWYST